MRVLVVTTWFPSQKAPTTGIFVERDVRLLATDHDVTVLHLGPPHEIPEPANETRHGIRIYRFPMAPSDPFNVARAARVVHRLMADADLVHSMALSSLLPLALIPVRKPWVHTEHWSAILAPETAPAAMRITMPLTLRLLSRPDVVVCVSESLARRVRQRRRKRTIMIPNYVEIPEERRSRTLTTSQVRLVAIGRLAAVKGPLIAVEAVSELNRRGIETSLRWVGDGPLRKSVEEAIANAGLEDRVQILGSVPHDVAMNELAHADVFLLPTATETFGVAIAEALAAGLPVVVGAEGAQAEFVAEPDGVLVSERTGEAYANGVERVLRLNRERVPADIGSGVRARFSETARQSAYRGAYAKAKGDALADRASRDEPDVDVVIPVHTPTRPIARAAASVLQGTKCKVRLTVVCHNTSVESIRDALGAVADDSRLRLVAFSDGIHSPTGPFNHGLDLATARFTSVMGSDDELERGAIDSWLSVAAESGADIVIPHVRRAGGRRVPTPPVRPFRQRKLRLVRDRLSYRSAPLGLVSRESFPELRFDATVPTGEDVSYVTRLWSSGAPVAYDRRGPAYLVHDDALDRTSTASRPIAGDLQFISPLLDDEQFRAMPPASRTAVATKLLRINVIGAIYKRRMGQWTVEDREVLASVVGAIRASAPRAERPLSLVDRRILDAASDADADGAILSRGAEARMRRLHPASLLTRSPLALFHREAPLRMGSATALQLLDL